MADQAPAPADTPVGPLVRLRQDGAALSGATRRVGEFVLDHPWEVRGLSISDLADHVGVSVNTVNRMTRALGYRGYRDFAQALALDLGKILGSAYSLPTVEAPRPGEDQDVLGVVGGTLRLEQQSLQETARQLDGAAVRRAVEALAGADSVLFAGTGSGLGVCATAAYRLTLIGVRAVVVGDPSAALAELLLLRPGDVLFVVSHHGATHHLVHTLRRGQSRGVTTICLTAAPGSPAAQAAGIALLTYGYEASGVSGQFASRLVAAAVAEALIAGVVWQKYGGTPPHVEEVLREQQVLNLEARARRGRRVAAP